MPFAHSIRSYVRLASIRATLLVGFGALVLCLIVAGSIAWIAVSMNASDVSVELNSVLTTARQTSDYANVITQEIQAGSRYLSQHDTLAEHEFRAFGHEAHQLQRRFTTAQHTPAEVAHIAAIDARLSQAENAYALAHRLSDLGRTNAERVEMQNARTIVSGILNDLQTFNDTKASEVTNTIHAIEQQSHWRATAVLATVAIAVLLALMVAIRTIRTINHPLRLLTHHASRLSEGDLGIRTPSGLPGEFETLGAAMNHAGASLARLVDVAAQTSADVTMSAGDLATASRQISESAHQVSEAVTEVSMGAESQVHQIQQTNAALETMLVRADRIAAGAEEVQALAGSIKTKASDRRSALERSMNILYNVRTIVRMAAEQVQSLNATVGDINKFIGTVGRIADQTNLLSLNAAIEAARAGDAGRGFGVVADEIRKLADQARVAADDIVELTESVTARVASTSTTMERGVTQVGEIEQVSREIDDTLLAILSAAERTKIAADHVAKTAEENVCSVQEATQSLAAIAKTAENHAATAMQVSASSEEQSAACEQMSAASAQLLDGSTRLRELVGELRTA
jgi:methyl-accepting chemotaxis protein